MGFGLGLLGRRLNDLLEKVKQWHTNDFGQVFIVNTLALLGIEKVEVIVTLKLFHGIEEIHEFIFEVHGVKEFEDFLLLGQGIANFPFLVAAILVDQMDDFGEFGFEVIGGEVREMEFGRGRMVSHATSNTADNQSRMGREEFDNILGGSDFRLGSFEEVLGSDKGELGQGHLDIIEVHDLGGKLARDVLASNPVERGDKEGGHVVAEFGLDAEDIDLTGNDIAKLGLNG